MIKARPAHTEIPLSAFLTDQVFATKAGETGVVIRLYLQDSECMETAEMTASAQRFDAAMRLITSEYRVYQYLVKRRTEIGGKSLFDFEVYLVLLRSDLNAAAVLQMGTSICAHLGTPELPACHVLDKEAAYRFFRQILNYDPVAASAARLKYTKHVDYYAVDSQIEVYREYLRVEDYFVKVLTLKDPPLKTYPDMLRSIRDIPCEYIAVGEWKPAEMESLKASMRGRVTYLHAAGYFGFSRQKERAEDRQRDESMVGLEKQMGELMKDMEMNGLWLGEFAFTVLLFDLDLARVTAAADKAYKAMAAVDVILYEERDNILAAWLAALPGGHKHQFRGLYLTNKNYADLAFLFSPARGAPKNEHLRAGCLAILETRQKTPYYANLHYQDVGHALISGMTGSGKSYLSAHLIEEAHKRYKPRIVIFDVGGSYRNLIAELGGSYMDIGLRHTFTINPFCLTQTEENRHFQFSFCKVLIEAGSHRMTDLEENELYRAIPGTTRLSALRGKLSDDLGKYLDRWVGEGQYADLFDHAEDTLTYAEIQAFDFQGLEKYPQILQPLLFYILHRANADIYNADARDRFKIFVLDEAWRFLLNPSVREYIHDSLKTWRKHNAAMWLATQSLGDLEQTQMLQTVAENCAYLVLLPNPRLDPEEYRRIFKLNKAEIEAVQTMEPKRESLWKPAVGESKIAILRKGK